MFKVNNRNTRTRCEICSKLTINMPERRQWRCSGIFIVNVEHISLCSNVSIVNFEQINAAWVIALSSCFRLQAFACLLGSFFAMIRTSGVLRTQSITLTTHLRYPVNYFLKKASL